MANGIVGRVAVVTSGAKGIVASNCRALAEAGAARCDVSSTDDVKAMAQLLADALGPIELPVNNAGLGDAASYVLGETININGGSYID